MEKITLVIILSAILVFIFIIWSFVEASWEENRYTGYNDADSKASASNSSSEDKIFNDTKNTGNNNNVPNPSEKPKNDKIPTDNNNPDKENPVKDTKLNMRSKFADGTDVDKMLTLYLRCESCGDSKKHRLFFYSYLMLTRSIKEYLSEIIVDIKYDVEIGMTSSQIERALERLKDVHPNGFKTEYSKNNSWLLFSFPVERYSGIYNFITTDIESFYIQKNQKIIKEILENNKDLYDNEVIRLIAFKNCLIEDFNRISPLDLVFGRFLIFLLGKE